MRILPLPKLLCSIPRMALRLPLKEWSGFPAANSRWEAKLRRCGMPARFIASQWMVTGWTRRK